ncbi:MAG: helix-turn-helix transcriptional regulator [Alteromonadaceae bacterium]|nr:helix-turn-helix transcriptional regulator [Alteromonadaceae bacterium]
MAKRVVATKAPNLNIPINVKSLGEFVRHKRTNLGLTIENAAALCCVSKQAFNNIELGLDTVKLVTLFKVTNGLGVDLWFENENYHQVKEPTDDWL